MKRFKIIVILLVLFLITGCFKRDSMEDINIITTVYPLEYLTNKLYGEHSVINSIYPDGVDVNNYELLEKQLKNSSSKDLFIYMGVGKDKDIAKELLNLNKNILIIDATFGMEINNGIEELWLNPSNLLMVGQNIKNGLKEYIDSKYLKESIDNYYEELKVSLSELDATLRVLAENANYKTLVVLDDSLKFLEKYGFTIVSLEGASTLDKAYNDAVNLINNGKCKYIFKFEYTEENEAVTSLLQTTKVEVVDINSVANLKDEERDNRDDYIKLMNDFMENIKKEAYK